MWGLARSACTRLSLRLVRSQRSGQANSWLQMPAVPVKGTTMLEDGQEATWSLAQRRGGPEGRLPARGVRLQLRLHVTGKRTPPEFVCYWGVGVIQRLVAFHTWVHHQPTRPLSCSPPLAAGSGCRPPWPCQRTEASQRWTRGASPLASGGWRVAVGGLATSSPLGFLTPCLTSMSGASWSAV